MKWFGKAGVAQHEIEARDILLKEVDGQLAHAKATCAIYKNERNEARGKCANLEIELRIAQGALNAANAKIERMTSGLRNHKPKVVS